MYEVEVKVPADLECVRKRLESLEAETRPLGRVVQADTYYDAPHRSFPETDEALRIRSERSASEEAKGPAEAHANDTGESAHGTADDTASEETRITYKGPLLDDESKTREELETIVADETTMDAVLTNLGFEAAATVRKSRDRYAVAVTDGRSDESREVLEAANVDELIVTLDEVDGVGEYVEVETEVDDDGHLEPARDAAYDLLERLGLDPADGVRTSYLGLLLAEGRAED
ncbi:class IV adenylate cyclase [Halobiforma nitratireducens]|uniref:Adenylyl cyclase CyaB n=1 Tax=Halobiforma nitratireducens JCM 10879 TaxID=1227454 RepID=M0M2X9_9EURY|nr:class IV adenylate cyclase [Halobiforma nitratireducens]EMA38760.1 adenylyl cyclase CyaB [Halobiforma nitratireducens JCM 10879]